MRTYLLTLLGLLVAAGLHAQHVTYDAGLTAGESFIFEYHPTEDVTSPRAHFYATVDGDIQAEEVQLTPLSTGGYQGVWKAPAGVQAVAFAIADGGTVPHGEGAVGPAGAGAVARLPARIVMINVPLREREMHRS